MVSAHQREEWKKERASNNCVEKKLGNLNEPASRLLFYSPRSSLPLALVFCRFSVSRLIRGATVRGRQLVSIRRTIAKGTIRRAECRGLTLITAALNSRSDARDPRKNSSFVEITILFEGSSLRFKAFLPFFVSFEKCNDSNVRDVATSRRIVNVNFIKNFIASNSFKFFYPTRIIKIVLECPTDEGL